MWVGGTNNNNNNKNLTKMMMKMMMIMMMIDLSKCAHKSVHAWSLTKSIKIIKTKRSFTQRVCKRVEERPEEESERKYLSKIKRIKFIPSKPQD